MKTILSHIVYFVLVCVFSACQDSGNSYIFTLKGELNGDESCKLEIRDERSNAVLYSSEEKSGVFSERCELPMSGLYKIQVGNRRGYFLLDGEEMVLKPGKVDFVLRLEGSPAEELKKEFLAIEDRVFLARKDSLQKAIGAVEREDLSGYYEKLSDLLMWNASRDNLVKDFISKHPGNIYSVVLALQGMDGDYDRGKAMYDLLTPEMQSHPLGKRLYENFMKYESTAIGKSVPAFQVETVDGDTVAFQGEGTLCVVDFWSSGCAPCRKEVAYMKALYHDFKDKGFCIVSVSMDDKRASWLKAHEEEKIGWTSVRNLDGMSDRGIRKKFGFNGIPYYVLLDKDGKIISKELRLRSLRNKVEEILGSN